MIVLGITNNDDAGACIIRDGHVVAASGEERFSRVKNHKVWPAQALAFVLAEAGIALEDVDRIAYGWNAGFDARKHLLLYVDRFSEEASLRPAHVAEARKRVSDELVNDDEKRLEFEAFLDANGLAHKAEFVDHHEAHGYGAFLSSPFESALVLTCDGRGDFQSLTVAAASDKNYDVLQQETSIDSIGYFYGRITHLLGFKPNRHEGKITGLAALGDPQKALPLMKEMIDLDSRGRLRAKCGPLFQPSDSTYSDELIARIAVERPEDVAAAAQTRLFGLPVGVRLAG